MAEPIDFYFDFSSPYGYLASTEIDGLAARHGRSVTWRPFVLGAAFKLTGQRALTEQPLRGDYARRDFARSARLLGVPFKLPEPFPFFALAASRACYWVEAPSRAKALAKAVYHAAFGEGRDITPVPVVAEIARGLGIQGLEQGVEQPASKAALRDATDQALARGVFGSPFFFVDGEPFWGHDRLDQLDRWLATGGW
ncbi:MAG TPA: 2-hydroxychromene-2-carboxylate isomerase [Verrucomicrobiae bacterium]|jgi:2-hydroxychromene-2-carboxylate isomerase|nr:2-hydroxychromene-2-carboxylate isomerase [Verrucomicrobiae bacterium]